MKDQLALVSPRFAEEALNLVVWDRTDELIKTLRLPERGSNHRYLVVLCKQHRQLLPHIPHAHYCDSHIVGIIDRLFFPLAANVAANRLAIRKKAHNATIKIVYLSPLCSSAFNHRTFVTDILVKYVTINLKRLFKQEH